MKNYTIYRFLFLLSVLLAGFVYNTQAQCPSIANATFSSTDVTCNGANDGTVTVTLGDGSAPFNYFLFDLNQGQFLLTATKIVGPANQVVFSDLGPSDYIVQVRKIGCPNMNIGGLGITVSEPSPFDLTITSQTNITSCFGDATGTFQVAASGGNGGYTYSFNGGPFAAITSFTNLTAGTYTVDAKDAKNCTQSISIVITQPAQLAINIASQTDPDCNGNTTGSISVTTSGGTPSYEFSMNGGAFTTSSGTFSNLVAGTYNIIVRDSKGCTATLPTVTLTNPPVLTINLTSKADITGCNGEATGQIIVSASGGTPGYTYSVNGAAFAVGTGTFANLTAGTYSIVVRDANNCSATLPTVTITEPTPVTISLVSKTDITGCNGDATGSIAVSASGGTPGYEFSVNGATFAPASTFTNLTAGTYTIQVRDSKGCLATLPTITITAPTALQVAVANQSNPTCFAATDGTIAVSAIGGTSPYTYSINGGVFASSSSFANLAAGTYNIQVKDSKGCLATLPTVTLTEPALLTITLTNKQDVTTCNGDATGEITTGVNGGTSSYTYSVNGAAFAVGTGTFANLTAGTYSIVVRDANNCSATLPTVTITEPTPVTISLVSKTDITGCNGDATGSIAVSASGGTPGYEFSVNGAAFGPASTFTNLTAGTYSIQVRDSKGCLATLPTVTVSEPTPVSISLSSKQDVTCKAGNNGNITVNANGGTAPYTYSINGGAFSSTTSFANLTAGAYTIQVKDANNCLATLPTITITEPTLLAISLTAKTDVIGCNGDATGNITVAATGGTAPYMYAINGGSFSTATIFSNLTAGSYNIQVKDVNNCTAILAPVTILQPTVLTINLASKTDITACKGDATGDIVVSTTGGTPGYSYSINGGTFAAGTGIFSNLTAGAYNIQVKDANNCSANLPTVTITEPTLLVISLSSKTDITACNGDATGSIAVSASGGTPAYEFSVNGAGFAPASTFTNLTAGTYSIQVRDSKGCLATLPTVTINQPSALSVSLISQTNVSCTAGNNGNINISASGGTSPYSYSINGGTFAAGTGTFNNLTAGTYNIQVKDANNCNANLPTVTITEPTLLVISLTSKTDITACNGDATGTIAVSAIGGTSPYTYSINGGVFASSSSFANLAAGTYNIQVKDSKGCLATLPTVTLTEPALLTITLTNKQDVTTCNGDATGEITTGVNGGTSSYTYSVNGAAFAVGTGTFANLTAGTYSIVVRDANNCSATLPTVTITEPTPVTISLVSKTDITGCNGDATGSIAVSASGGTPGYEFSVNGAAFGPASTFTNLTAGTYSIQVRDSKGCLATLPTVTVSEPTPVSISLSSKQDVTCKAGNNGNITVNANGGTPGYEFSINSSAFAASNTFSNLTAGSYNIQVRDSKGCLATLPTVTITEPSLLVISLSSKNDIVGCSGDATGSIIVSASGGNPGYTYSINGAAFAAGTGIFSNLTAGAYNIQVKDANNCNATLPTVTITEPTLLVISLTSKTDITACNGDATGTIAVSASGGTAPFMYSINGGAFAATNTFSNLTAGTYNIQVRDSKGCMAALPTVILTQPVILAVALVSQTNPGCNGSNTGTIIVSASGGTSPYTYSVNGGVFGNSASFNNLAAGTYDIQLKDAKGCTDSLPTVTLATPVALSISVSAKTDPACNGDTNGSITVMANGGTPNYQYSINGGSFVLGNVFNNLPAGTYNISVQDANSCTAVASNIILTAPAALSATISTRQDVNCNGAATGSITVATAGGTTPYMYSVNGGTFTAGPGTFSNLTAGAYNIQVKDASGCIFTLPATNITQPAILNLVISSQTNINACAGNTTGSITVSATGGNSPYTYSIDGSTFMSSNIFNNLAAGNYMIQIKDANNCTQQVNTTITNTSSTLTASSILQDPSCNGGSDGSITISNVTGGSGNYEYSLDGTIFQTTASFTTLSAGNYTVTIRDKNTIVCKITLSANLTNPALLTAATTSMDPTSCTSGNGTITVNASGGTSPYTYAINGGSFANNKVFTNLSSGNYNIIVKDAKGCTFAIPTETLDAPGTVNVSLISKTDITCFGSANGVIVVSASGGVSPYSYSVDGVSFGASASFASLPVGSYANITIKDANGCLATLPAVTLTEPALLAISLSNSTNPDCSNPASGSILTSVSGGTTPYTYSVNGSAFSAGTGSFTNLSAGSYDIIVKDAKGCSAVLPTVSLTPASSMSATITATDPSACSASDGSITISASGGTAPYRYSLDDISYQTSNTFSTLAAADYILYIQDATGCKITRSHTLTAAGGLTASLLPVDESGCNVKDGLILVSNQNGASGPYTYFIDGVLNPSGANNNVFTGLSGNSSYLIRIEAANGCSYAETVFVGSPCPPPVCNLTASLTAQDVSCNGASDGSITVTANGGSGNYEYSLDGTTFQNSNIFSAVGQGSYTVTVRDKNDNTCQQTPGIVIIAPAVLTATVSGVNSSGCTTADGSINVSTTSGGTAPYTYSLDGVTFQASGSFTALADGTYSVYIKDAKGCQLTQPQTLTSPGGITASTVAQDVSCNGANDGNIIVTVNGGSGSYEYSLDGTTFQNSHIFSALGQGNYTITVRDKSSACLATVSQVVTEPAVIAASFTKQDVSGCNGNNNGSITLTASGGTAPYSYSLDGVTFQASNILNNLVADTYSSITIKDAKGCSTTIPTINISQPNALSISLNNLTGISCNGANDGQITVSASGGMSPYTYSIDGTTFVASAIFNNLSVGSYDIILKDANSCTDTLQNIILTEPTAISAMLSFVNPTGCTTTDGSIAVATTTGGTSPYSYSIDGITFQASTSFTNLSGGTYIIYIKDSKGCIITRSQTITSPTGITASVSLQDVSCNGANDGGIIVSVSGGSGSYEYSIDNGANYQNSNSFSALAAGSYTITVRDKSSACLAIVSQIVAEPLVLASSFTKQDVSGCNGASNGSITLTASGGTAPYNYSLDGVTFQASNILNNLVAGTYSSITIKDAKGCSITIPTINISQPNALQASISDTDPTGCNTTDGSLIVTASGGSGTYEYSIDGATFQASATFSNLSNGTYTIIIRDKNNDSCTISRNTTLSDGSSLTATPIVTDETTCQAKDGKVTVNVTGGTAPYQYFLGSNTSANAGGNIFDNLTPGNYSIRVVSSDNCQFVQNNVTVNAATCTPVCNLTATLKSTAVVCNGQANGTVQVIIVSGGSGNYEYSIDNGANYQNSPSFTNLPTGTYTITVRDKNNLTCTASFAADPVGTTFFVSGVILRNNPPACSDRGSIEFRNVGGGTAPYQFSVDGINFQSGNVFANLLTGTYQATIKDANNCQYSVAVSIGGAAPVTATALQTSQITCDGATDGQITVTATGGTGPYQYAINSGSFAAGNGILTNLAAGTYNISVRDASNCIFNLPTITLTTPAAITASISAQANPACSTNNGSITVSASGGTGTLMYSKDNGAAFVTNGNFTGLAAGTYTIVVKDANNCTVTLPAVTLTLPVITTSINGTDPNSCTASNGSIIVNTPTGGTAPYMYSLNGGAYQTSVTFSGLASGNYTITVKDANDCQITLTKSLNSSGGITALSITPTPETACGINDGKITVSSVTGAAGPYEYYIDDVANPAGINANIFTGLTPKTYTIKVVAANGCIFTTTSTVNAACTPNCNLTIDYKPTHVICNGQPTGEVQVIIVSGGSGSYEYSINGGPYQPTPKFNNLPNGNYTITARDKNNLACTASVIAQILANSNVAGIIVHKDPQSCNEKGSITFTNVSGGQSAYSFSIDGTTFKADTLYKNLDGGIYQATIRDANNCTFSTKITIKNVLPIAAIASQSAQVSCNGGSDGKIILANITGGTGTYVYSLDGTTFTGSPEFTNLKAGLYNIYVKDQNGTCINSFPVTVTEPATLVANPVIVKQPGNCSAKDGEIKLDVTSGGTAPFEYKLNNGNYQSSDIFTGLDGGNYTITLRDASGCISTFTTSLSVSNTITAQAIQVSPASCNSNPDGEAQVNVITGSGSYEFSKDGITYQASNTFTGLKAGNYLLSVKDKNTGCIASSSVTIDGAIQITANIPAPINPSTCIAKDGKIQINSVNGGSGTYQFSLDSLTNFQSGTLPFEFTGLSNGSYKVFIKDSKGCYGIYTYTLASPNSVAVGSGITITPPTCKGSNNGKLDINPAGNNVTGGQLPYQYSLDGITYQSTSAFNSLLAGKYTVRVKEASGCIYLYNYEITEPAGIEFVVQEVSGAGCGETTGSVKVQNIKGGISPYTFSLDNINYQLDSLFTGLTAGSFKMYVKDASGQNVCENVKPFNVSGAMPLTFKVSTENIGCAGGNKGKIIVKEIIGGLSAENTKLRFSINNGKTFRDESASEVVFDNLAPGVYQLIINYGKNFACGTKMQEVRITSAGIPFVVDTVAATCGSPNGMATAVIAGGGNYFYSIDSLNYFQTPQFENLKPGLYKMYVKESANDKCLNIQPFIIPGPDSLKYDLVKENCFDIRLTKIRGGMPPYRVSLDGGATFVSGNLFSNTYTAENLLTGDYQVVLVDSKGCTTIPIRVKIDNRIVAKVKATLSLPDEPTGEIRISDIRGGNAPYEVSIDGITWGVVKDKTLPIDTIITTQPMGKYTVYIRDASGCVKEYDTEIKESKFTIPNVFTPNGDGVNDTFFIRNLPAGTFVTISNRWGKVIFTSSDYQNDWNGGNFPDGVYYYTVNIAASGNFTGWVQIWR